MGTSERTQAIATSDLSLLLYALHMAETARPDAAKRLFESVVEQERRRMEANGGYRLSVPSGQDPRTGRRERSPDEAKM